jgi:DHA1 family bicyclomycin/chloramphenicol resistance-like MFS transporter
MNQMAVGTSVATADGTRVSEWRLILVLVLATAIGPFSMQVFLPALPAIQASYDVTAATAQLSFSLSAFAMAVATLFYGPVSDRIGRRRSLIAGIVVFIFGSLICAFAASIGWLIVGRIVQAAGGVAGMVLGRAIVRDVYDRERSASAIAYITMAMVVAPMLAPAIGGVLTDLIQWQAVFLLGGGLGVLVLATVHAGLPETLARSDRPTTLRSMLGDFRRLLREPAFVGYALHGGFSMAVFFSFLAAAPYVMITILERPPSEYGLMFILVSASFMAGNFLTARISRRIGIERMIVMGSIGTVVGTATILALVPVITLSPWALFLPMMLVAFSQGTAIPNALAAVVSIKPEIAGAASGLAGFLQMGIAAVAAQTIGSIQTGTPWPMAIGMSSCAALMLAFALFATHRR